ncbi:hypothetical protein BJY24_007157 [Nocardia transvalensis]|uniref:Uncharacterized protein n=1 Tax=Nocardia transvalensis TaxID=37333 RepID=A0A7W9PL99_9NOCA|nr:hypothetical protein [Nocardia transvalensis]MBB5918245.1 hypothetical protein [Nocardia transvalensis]
MIAIRVLLALGGIWLAWYGIGLLLDQNPADLMSIARWFAGGIVLHDAILAPLCAAVALLARRLLPAPWWASVAWGGLCTATLLLISIPVLQRSGENPANPSVLDRNYHAGLLIAVAVVWVFVALDITRRYARTRPIATPAPDRGGPRNPGTAG